jgi:hypothetical protein
MSFPSFNISLPTLPTIPNPFVSSKSNESNDKSFELVKYVTEKDLYTYNYDMRDLSYTMTIGYITSKYVANIKDTGCYTIMINSQISEGPNGIFCLSLSDKSKKGIVNTLVSSYGKADDRLEVIWNPMEHPCVLLKHNFTKKHILKDETKLRFGYDIRFISP